MPKRYARIACVSLILLGVATIANPPSIGFAQQASTPSYQYQSQTNSGQVQPAQVRSQQAVASPEYSFSDRPAWPAATTLISQVESVQEIPEMKRWCQETIDLLNAITKVQPNSTEQANYLNQLEAQSKTLPQLSRKIWRRAEQVAAYRTVGPQVRVQLAQQHCDVARLSYRLGRRLDIWKSLYVSSQKRTAVDDNFSDSPFQSVSLNRISFDQLDLQWVEYLELKELQSAYEVLNSDPSKIKEASRKVLARIYSPVLRPDQANYVKHIIDPTIVRFLREKASDPVSQEKLLGRIENYEARSSALTGYYLNDLYQSLLWSNDPADQAIASDLQTHYRNANFRIAISQDFLNRMVPALPSTASPVSQNINGARVSGQSHVSNQLRVDLVPNQNNIVLNLATVGQVQSDTIARTKTFRVQNQGQAEFQVIKPIVISPRGIDSSAKPYAHSTGNQSVVRLQSTLDDIPLVGRIARAMASKKLRKDAPKTDRMFQQTVKSSAESQMQQQVEQQVASLRQKVYANLYQPLLAMELEPEAVQMSTTDEQIVMRYRLAGRDQMAAHTARPRDNGNSLISFQVHETALNNSIARLGLNGNTFTIDELKVHLSEVLGTSNSQTSDEPSAYAEIGFAPLDPIHIAFHDDRLLVTLNLKTFKVKGKVWRSVTMTAAYKVVINGMQVSLQQDDEGTRIKGKRTDRRRFGIGDRMAISAAMKKIFPQQRVFDAMPPSLKERLNGQPLEVSQLVVSDGWLAVSIDDQNQPYAGRPLDGSRIGALRRLMIRK